MGTDLMLDAALLTDFQACRRRSILQSRYRFVRYRPKELFDALLRQSIIMVSKGDDPRVAADGAAASFMQIAANPGLDMQGDVYNEAKEWSAMLGTVLRVVCRPELPLLHPLTPVRISNGIFWRFLAHEDEKGRLHRWITRAFWNEDDLVQERQNWFCVGDMALAGQSMTLHIVEIGKKSDSGRASPWVRGWRNAYTPNGHLHFRSPRGKPLKGKWNQIQLVDNRQWDSDRWVDTMIREGEPQRLIHSITLTKLDETETASVVHHIAAEAERISELLNSPVEYVDVPMSRGACFHPAPCPFRYACYAPQDQTISEIGVYQERERR